MDRLKVILSFINSGLQKYGEGVKITMVTGTIHNFRASFTGEINPDRAEQGRAVIIGSSVRVFSGKSSQSCLIIPLSDLLFLSRCRNTPVQGIVNQKATLFPQPVHFLTQ